MRMLIQKFIVVLLVSLLVATSVLACSRALWNTKGHAVTVGRNMDWINNMPVDFFVIPQGIERDGFAGQNSVKWKSKYGQLALVREGAGVLDGVNEKGLAGHMLWLGASDYGTRDLTRPAISLGMWLQYCLDNFATVAEVADAFEKDPFQIVTTIFDNLKASTHLAFEDATGDSVVIEYQSGKPKVYHDRKHTVMTNDPVFSKQLEKLANYKGFGGNDPLPGSNAAADRFVRAAYFIQGLPKALNDREAVAYVFSVMRNVSQPFGEVDVKALASGNPHNSPTRWRTVIDLTNGNFYYESTLSPNVIWVKYKELDFSPASGIRKLDLQGEPLIGDSTKGFKPAKGFSVLTPGS